MVFLSHPEEKVHITDPLLPFGSVHTESLYPIFQSDGTYGINTQQELVTTSGSGAGTTVDSAFKVSTGTTIYSFATIQSRKRLRYRAGQGLVGRFTARFPTTAENSILVAGFGHSEDGLFVGFNGTRFGILYSQRGVREQQTLTITTKSSTAENVTVTLGGVAFTVAVTNGANTQQTAYEISRGTFTGWDAEATGSTVLFIRGSAGDATGAFSLAGTTVVGAFVETVAGVAATEQWIYKEDFNGNTLNSRGSENFILDHTKFNVFQVGIQYLGAGIIYLDMEMTDGDGFTDWVRVHTIRPANTITRSTFGNPSFPFTMAAYSAGSTTDLSVETICFAGFIEGQKKLHGPRFSYYNTITTATSAAFHCLFTIRANRALGGRSSQAIVNLLNVAGACKHTQPVTLFLIKNATLAGAPVFSSYGANSNVAYDSSATTCTFSTNDQLIWIGQLGETGDIDHHFINDEVTLQPGESMTLACRASTGTPAYVLGTINTREDQ